MNRHLLCFLEENKLRKFKVQLSSMVGSPICFSRNRSPAPIWSSTYNYEIITSSYEHILLKLMRCLWKNTFTTCFWTFWDILSWKLQMGSLWEKLPPALSRYAHPAPCWQEHQPFHQERPSILWARNESLGGKATRLCMDGERPASLLSGNLATAADPRDKDEWSCQVGLALLELPANWGCF